MGECRSTVVDRPARPAPAPTDRPGGITQDDRAAELNEIVATAAARLADELNQGHTAGYLELLAFYGRFWRYSVTNCFLIRRQCPHASRVAGYRLWQKLGYQVAKGERALWIWCPMLKRERDETTGEEEERVVGFRPGPVFDASQLANLAENPLPALFAPLPDDAEERYRATRTRIEAAGIAVSEERLPTGIQGVSRGGRILIRQGLDSRSRLFVLLHELVHELAHRDEAQAAKPINLKEFEAESVSYVVAAALGLPHPTARDYLLSYRGTAEVLHASLATIQRLVRAVLRIVAPAAPDDGVRP